MKKLNTYLKETVNTLNSNPLLKFFGGALVVLAYFLHKIDTIFNYFFTNIKINSYIISHFWIIKYMTLIYWLLIYLLILQIYKYRNVIEQKIKLINEHLLFKPLPSGLFQKSNRYYCPCEKILLSPIGYREEANLPIITFQCPRCKSQWSITDEKFRAHPER